jgi:hypothetical protein
VHRHITEKRRGRSVREPPQYQTHAVATGGRARCRPSEPPRRAAAPPTPLRSRKKHHRPEASEHISPGAMSARTVFGDERSVSAARRRTAALSPRRSPPQRRQGPWGASASRVTRTQDEARPPMSRDGQADSAANDRGVPAFRCGAGSCRHQTSANGELRRRESELIRRLTDAAAPISTAVLELAAAPAASRADESSAWAEEILVRTAR